MGTIKSRLSTLAFASKTLEYSECMSDFWVRRMLVSWHREEVPRKDPHQPLSPGILQGLQEVWDTVCTLESERALFNVASLLVFFGVLRIGELVALSKWDRLGRLGSQGCGHAAGGS